MEKTSININEQEEIFDLIGKTLKEKLECYAVGGTAMMFLGLKETTKDIDLIFLEKKHYENFRDILIRLGAKEPTAKVTNKEEMSTILTLGKARFDLFLKKLIHYRLTESIITRAKEIHEFGNLLIKVASPEDIIFFKSMADREGDRIDVSKLIKNLNINWEIILEESENQTKDSEFFFVAFLCNFLIGVKEDLNIEIPKEFLKKLEKLTKKALLEAEKKIKRKK